MKSGKPWYVIQTKPHQERIVFEYLQFNLIQVYLPLIKVNPVNPRASKNRPLFNGYLFAKFDVDTVIGSKVQWSPGVTRLVRFGDDLATVSDQFLQEIRRKVDDISAAGGLNMQGIRKGDLVHIQSGPFEGYDAIFDFRLSDNDRVHVFLQLLENHAKGVARLLPLELPAGDIIRKEPPSA